LLQKLLAVLAIAGDGQLSSGDGPDFSGGEGGEMLAKPLPFQEIEGFFANQDQLSEV
jgi:hypothetical protein